MRIGQGFDVHRFGPGDHLWLGGVRIEHEQGLIAHSDGDVLLHALIDALLGASGQGDIGQHFPDTDAAHAGADSAVFLCEVWQPLKDAGWRLANADLCVIGERPKVGPHRDAMSRRIADLLDVRPDQINVKATTTEGLGFCGRREGLAATATVLLQPPPSSESL